MRLLLIEDTAAIRDPLAETLRERGFVVDGIATGEEGLRLASINSYDCIVLDINLPGNDGLTVARTMRQESNTTPIIMLTARTQTYNKLEGFDAGADDYVTKPFSTDELVARIEAVIRRHSTNKHQQLSVGDITLIPVKNQAVHNEQRIELSSKETRLLEFLIRNKGNAVSAETILEHVWGDEVDAFTDTVKTHIKTLRKKIDPNKQHIKTIRNKGYIIEE